MFKHVLSLVFTIATLFSSAIYSQAESTETRLVPCGKSIGVTLSTDGVMVVNVAEVQTGDGKTESPARTAGIKPGDMIKEFNGVAVSDVDGLVSAVNQSGGKGVPIVLQRNEKTIETLIIPKPSSDDGSLKIGAWIKDAASGIGTMTYFNPANNTFAALGHGICDVETGNIIPLDSGNILSSTIVTVEKGTRGSPGELKGVFAENQNILGTINQNTPHGIFGILENTEAASSSSALPVAKRNEVTPGKACIMTNVEGNIVEEFEVEIVRVMPQNTSASKDMIIRITDEKLLQKTGGIVQGMSGSPILQNGRIVGAVTHV